MLEQILAAAALVESKLAAARVQQGINSTQMLILVSLAGGLAYEDASFEPQCTVQLARSLGMRANRVSMQMSQLVDKGLVRTVPSTTAADSDRRLRWYRLTRRGAKDALACRNTLWAIETILRSGAKSGARSYTGHSPMLARIIHALHDSDV